MYHFGTNVYSFVTRSFRRGHIFCYSSYFQVFIQYCGIRSVSYRIWGQSENPVVFHKENIDFSAYTSTPIKPILWRRYLFLII